MNNHEIILQRIRGWIEGQGLSLVSGMSGEYDPFKSLITYSTKLSGNKLIYELLHECGHHIISVNAYPNSDHYKIQRDAQNDKRKERSMFYRMGILREEFQAWDEGYQLASSLSIIIDHEDYYRFAAKYIAYYCDWISRRKWGEDY